MSRPSAAQIEEAATWLLRLRERRSHRLQQDFARWLASDPVHEIAFRYAESVFGALEAPAAVLADRDARSTTASASTLGRHRLRRWAAIAVAVLVVGGAGVRQLDVVTYLRADIVTGVGETRSLPLPDGSLVTLNTDTALRYHVQDGVRRVSLDRGEAFFEVTRDPARPFIVESDDAEVEVVGTRFNVRRTPDGTAVSVLEGRVRLRTMGRTNNVLISAGRAGVVSSGEAAERSSPDVDAALAWREGRAVFYGATLADVVGELARYRRAPVVIVNRRIRGRTLSGVFDIRRPDDALEIAAKTVKVKVARLPGGVSLIY